MARWRAEGSPWTASAAGSRLCSMLAVCMLSGFLKRCCPPMCSRKGRRNREAVGGALRQELGRPKAGDGGQKARFWAARCFAITQRLFEGPLQIGGLAKQAQHAAKRRFEHLPASWQLARVIRSSVHRSQPPRLLVHFDKATCHPIACPAPFQQCTWDSQLERQKGQGAGRAGQQCAAPQVSRRAAE